MWNVPLISGTTLSVAIGCVLFLYGLSLGLLVAGICLAFVASGGRQASPSQETYPSISDEEIEIVAELVRGAVARSGWTLCGDCYARLLLQKMQQLGSGQAPVAGVPSVPAQPGLHTPERWRTPLPFAEEYVHLVGARPS